MKVMAYENQSFTIKYPRCISIFKVYAIKIIKIAIEIDSHRMELSDRLNGCNFYTFMEQSYCYR